MNLKLIGFLLLGVLSISAVDRPNIVWILSEDNSKHYLDIYESTGAHTPVIASLAQEGLIFDRAFSNAPVCSVARTTLMTGLYLPGIGAQYHRRQGEPIMPDGLKLFPAYLKALGYYTTNNSKEDYNVSKGSDVWSESSNKASWSNRPDPKMPFFHMHTFTDSHESRLHFSESFMEKNTLIHDPAKVVLPPHYPDTKLFRYTYAYYLDRMQVIDKQVGTLVDKLKKEGLYENTIIFYFGDHGGVLPRSKGYIYDTGLHVPLVVYIPQKWQGLSPFKNKSRVSGFVSFVDFGATVLNLVGVDVPKTIQGKAFLGTGLTAEDINQRDTTFSYADRFDEQYAFKRAVRVGDFKYIRHYTPYIPDALYSSYRSKMLATQEWYALNSAGRLTDLQSQFFRPRQAEELYDMSKDPFELNDLAQKSDYKEIKDNLRSALTAQLKEIGDLGFYPEGFVLKEAKDSGSFKAAHTTELNNLIDLANAQVLEFSQAETAIEEGLNSSNQFEQYWALRIAASFGEKAVKFSDKAMAISKGKSFYPALQSSEFLAVLGNENATEAFHNSLKLASDSFENVIALNTGVFLKDFCGLKLDFVEYLGADRKNDYTQRRLLYLEPSLASKDLEKKKKKSK